jgi:AraC family transcriptional regulator
MAYARARRLSRAAELLADGDQDILTIALDTGYGSHEAFTRAFAGYFGALPSSVRSARSLSSLSLMEPMKMKNDMIVEVPAHEIKECPAFRVAGLSERFTFENTGGIPALWQSFNEREDELAGPISRVAYGVCCDADEGGRFRYLAGIEVGGGIEMPKGMDFVDIPAGRYAVFTHRGHVSDLPKSVYTIWNKSLPDAGLVPAKAPDFELYDRRFDPKTGRGVVEIWIPVGQAGGPIGDTTKRPFDNAR